MPINFDELPEAEGRPIKKARTDSTPPLPEGEDALVTLDAWAGVFGPHPQSGGPFGGRDNALVKLVGFLRAKAVPFEAGRLIAQTWNRAYCQPPLADRDVTEKVSRAWATWAEGNWQDRQPDTLASRADGPIAFLTWPDMESLEAETGVFRWLAPNLLPETGLVYLSAPPAGGKSWLLLDLARCLVQGARWIGRFPLPVTPTLYIDEEMGVRKVLPRLRKLGMPPCVGFRYTNQAGVKIDNRQHVEQILDVCARDGIRVIIIDTLTRVHSKDENDNSQMRTLFEYLTLLLKAGLLVVIAHHDRKGGQADSRAAHERMRGAGEIAASADMTYSVEKRGSLYHLECTKSRLASEDDTASIDFVIEDNPDRTRTVLRPVDSDEKAVRAQDKIAERILTALAIDGPQNVTRLTQTVKGSPNATIAALDVLEQTGRVRLTRHGHSKMYQLAS